MLERCLPAELEAEPIDSTEQPGLESTEESKELNEEVETDVLEPNCNTGVLEPNCDMDVLEPNCDTWASDSEVDSERSTTLVVAPPPEMERNVKSKYSLRSRVKPPERLCRSN